MSIEEPNVFLKIWHVIWQHYFRTEYTLNEYGKLVETSTCSCGSKIECIHNEIDNDKAKRLLNIIRTMRNLEDEIS